MEYLVMTLNAEVLPRHVEDVNLSGETLVQMQSRVFKSLRHGMISEAATSPADSFLRAHLYHKVPMVVLYADLVGSTDMSLTVPVDTLSTIIRIFFQETSIAITEHGGYVLKYAGDSVLAFFPMIGSDSSDAEDAGTIIEAMACGKRIIAVIQQVINPILSEYYHPELAVRIGADAGHCAVVLYGNSAKQSYVDILGPCISLAAKMKAFGKPNSLVAGKSILDNLTDGTHTSQFSPLETDIDKWHYVDDSTGQIYPLYQYLP
jgi:adenylate cyclase